MYVSCFFRLSLLKVESFDFVIKSKGLFIRLNAILKVLGYIMNYFSAESGNSRKSVALSAAKYLDKCTTTLQVKYCMAFCGNYEQFFTIGLINFYESVLIVMNLYFD